jgi:hypothetical protein
MTELQRKRMREDARVAVAKTHAPRYPSDEQRSAPGENEIAVALSSLARELGWGESGRAGGAFNQLIPAGAREA